MNGDSDHRTWNILLVDDDPDFLHAAQRVLRRSSHLRANIETAQAAAEALKILDEKLTDVVMADFRMAPEDGTELLRRVQASRPETKRILLTGFDADKLKELGLQESDADLVLDKNDLLEDLDRKLTAFLQSPADSGPPGAI